MKEKLCKPFELPLGLEILEAVKHNQGYIIIQGMENRAEHKIKTWIWEVLLIPSSDVNDTREKTHVG